MDYRGCIVRASSDKVWKVGRRPVFDVRLASGRSIRATAKHRLYGAEGWVRIGELKVGDRLAAARSLPEPVDALEWPDSRVALLGQLIGDGSYLVHQPLRYTTESEANSRVVEEGARELGSDRQTLRRAAELASAPHQRQRESLASGRCERVAARAGHSRPAVAPEAHSRGGVPSLEPSGRSALAPPLGHRRDHLRRSSRLGKATIYYATTSPGLGSDVAALLLRIGITAQVRSGDQAGVSSQPPSSSSPVSRISGGLWRQSALSAPERRKPTH